MYSRHIRFHLTEVIMSVLTMSLCPVAYIRLTTRRFIRPVRAFPRMLAYRLWIVFIPVNAFAIAWAIGHCNHLKNRIKIAVQLKAAESSKTGLIDNACPVK